MKDVKGRALVAAVLCLGAVSCSDADFRSRPEIEASNSNKPPSSNASVPSKSGAFQSDGSSEDDLQIPTNSSEDSFGTTLDGMEASSRPVVDMAGSAASSNNPAVMAYGSGEGSHAEVEDQGVANGGDGIPMESIGIVAVIAAPTTGSGTSVNSEPVFPSSVSIPQSTPTPTPTPTPSPAQTPTPVAAPAPAAAQCPWLSRSPVNGSSEASGDGKTCNDACKEQIRQAAAIVGYALPGTKLDDFQVAKDAYWGIRQLGQQKGCDPLRETVYR